VGTARAQLEERLINLYKGGSLSSSHYLEVLFSTDDLVSVLERFDMTTKLADRDQELFDQVKSFLVTSRSAKVLLEATRTEQTAELGELQRLQEETSGKLAESSAQYQSLKNHITTLTAEIRRADAAATAAAAAARARAIAANAWKAGQAWNNSANGRPYSPLPSRSR
jgi:peptidoglycan hydrolase CwlO-like protein